MADKIRVGIVGATVTTGGSGWGANAHVSALAHLPDFELKAVCTTREETARASKERFGADLAFTDITEMAMHPEVDLVAVVVRVPGHYDLVTAGLQADKPVFCEWPLGAHLEQAREMDELARRRDLDTFVGLQGRSSPAFMYAKDLVARGYIGEVLAAQVTVITQQVLERGPGRIWQGDRTNGANTLTITGGHTIDALCYVLGEFSELTARVRTVVNKWKHADTGEMVDVDSPDSINVAGVLQSGAEVSFQVLAVPHNPSGARVEIYGRDGTLVLQGSANIGPSTLWGSKGTESLVEMPPPDEYLLAPKGTPSGAPYNVAQAYARYARSLQLGQQIAPDFGDAVVRHQLIDAIERSSTEGRSISLPD